MFCQSKFCAQEHQSAQTSKKANQAQSKADFIHKLSISQKEAFETDYWLRLLRDSEYLMEAQVSSLLNDCRELQKLLTASIKYSKRKCKAMNLKLTTYRLALTT